MTHKICVIEGDGIGHEVIPAAIKVLNALGLEADYTYAKAGYACYKECGTSIPDETLVLVRQSNATLFGAVTSPPNIPNYKSAIITLRRELKTWANLRPSYPFPSQIARPIKKKVDLVIVRENSEDLYVGKEKLIDNGETAIAERIITKKGSERIIKYAFEYAQQNNRKKVTLIHKANILRVSDGLFLRTFEQLAKNYPGIQANEMLVDSASMRLITHPENFDVIVTSNMFGDILSDEVAGLNGGLGLAASANIGSTNAMFEPVHGSAPDIAGKHMANPLATFYSCCMMLDWLKEKDLSKKLQHAIDECIRQEMFTPDLGGDKTTEQVTDFVISVIN